MHTASTLLQTSESASLSRMVFHTKKLLRFLWLLAQLSWHSSPRAAWALIERNARGRVSLYGEGAVRDTLTQFHVIHIDRGVLASVGLYAIQVAAMYGLNVITTCSPRHHDQARKLGAKHVFDYRDEDIVSKIVNAEPNLKYVFDTIGNDKSSVTASQAITSKGGRLCTVRPGKAFTEGVSKQTTVTDVLVWTAFLKEHRYGEFFWPVRAWYW